MNNWDGTPNQPCSPVIPPNGPWVSAASDQDVHILDRVSIVYRHRRIVLTVALLVVIGAIVQTYTAVPVYKAHARLLIEDERSALAGFKDGAVTYYQDPELYYQTQYRVLKGRELARRVAARLELEKVPEFTGEGPRRRPSVIVASWGRRVLGAIVSPFKRKSEPADPAEQGLTAAESALVDAFLSRVSVEPVRDSRLVDLVFQATDPRVATRAVNVLAEEYIQQNLAFKLQATERTLAWLSDESAKQQANLRESERALQQYRETQNAASLEDRQNIVVARLTQLNEAVTRAKTVRMQKEALYRQVQALGKAGALADTFPAALQNASIHELNGYRVSLQREQLRLSADYGEKHPAIVTLNASIEDAARRLAAETATVIDAARNEYLSAEAEERALSGALENQKRAAVDLGRKGVTYTVLERDAQSHRQVYEALLQHEKELRIVGSNKANNVRLMDRAEEPTRPFTPNPRRTLLIAVILGLTLGVGLAFGVDYLDDSIKTPDDITRRLRLPFLGMVPAVHTHRPRLLIGAAPHDFGEAFRAVRTALVFTSGRESTRSVLVTSAQPLEGKTTTACNLAVAFALGGARVLLIDADMRRPGLHKALGLHNNAGLSHVLVGQADVHKAIQATGEPNLWVLTAGRVPPNPSELLGSSAMKQLLAATANAAYDWVIVDTPPVLAVTDAVILAPVVSGVAFVLGAEMTRRRLAERAIEMLMTSKPRILGAVLNRVDFTRNKYYYKRYYGYQHTSSYDQAPATPWHATRVRILIQRSGQAPAVP